MNKALLLTELNFKAIRSSGAGGQHVNKVSSKVVLSFAVLESKGLNEEEKALILKNLVTKLSTSKTLSLSCDESRSQHRNKEMVINRFFETLKKALFVPKARKKTKPTKSSNRKRLESKKKHAFKKSARKRLDDY
ncbi:MAG: aminoacyl-tRNA hydrolase [Flavobacteriaceae bacterium]|nr:MAG: aminoacyl-tRNA hydrolase [Flavobacteriaceae bacterium]